MRGLRGLGIRGMADPVFSAGCPGGANLAGTILSYSPIAYWPLSEVSGTTAINYGSLGTAANGTYSGPTLAQMAAPGGGLSPLFDGNDRVSIATATLLGGLTPARFTYICFGKVYNAGVWTDGANRALVYLGYANNPNTNYIQFNKSTAANTLQYRILSNGGTYNVTKSLASTNWFMYIFGKDESTDETIYGVNLDITSGVTADAFTGVAFTAGQQNIGSVTSAASFWYGYISHVAFYNSLFTSVQAASIYSASGL